MPNNRIIVVATGLTEGEYFFRETAAPAGYVKRDDKYEFTVTYNDEAQGVQINLGKAANDKETSPEDDHPKNEETPEEEDHPEEDHPVEDNGEVLGANRDRLNDDDQEVLGRSRSPKTSDASNAILWMLVMGGSSLGAAAVLARKRKKANR